MYAGGVRLISAHQYEITTLSQRSQKKWTNNRLGQEINVPEDYYGPNSRYGLLFISMIAEVTVMFLNFEH